MQKSCELGPWKQEKKCSEVREWPAMAKTVEESHTMNTEGFHHANPWRGWTALKEC